MGAFQFSGSNGGSSGCGSSRSCYCGNATGASLRCLGLEVFLIECSSFTTVCFLESSISKSARSTCPLHSSREHTIRCFCSSVRGIFPFTGPNPDFEGDIANVTAVTGTSGARDSSILTPRSFLRCGTDNLVVQTSPSGEFRLIYSFIFHPVYGVYT